MNFKKRRMVDVGLISLVVKFPQLQELTCLGQLP